MKRMATSISLAALSMCALADYSAFARKAFDAGFIYNQRDAEPNPALPSLEEIKENQDKILNTFEQLKEKNDARLAEIEKKGGEDPVAREQLEKIVAEMQELTSLRDDMDEIIKKAARRPQHAIDGAKNWSEDQQEHRKAFNSFLRKHNDTNRERAMQEAEQKAVDTQTDAAGGHGVPEIISSTIEDKLTESRSLRNLVDVQVAGSKDFKQLINLRGAAYGWVGETDARTETATSTLGEVAPTFGTLYAYPKATEESMFDIFFDVEKWIINETVEGFVAGEENAIVNGNGTNKPTGFLNGTPVVTDDASRTFGVLQFVATGIAADWAATNKADVLKTLVYEMKAGHRSNANWLMNKNTAGEIMLFKDGDGNYLWQPSSVLGQPDRLFGHGVEESEEMPDKAANAFPVAFGDFKAGYLLVELVGLRMIKDEITTPGYVKWYIRRRLGGKIKNSDAIKLIKIAA